ncbi:MAG: O-antigen ligase family protein, partial [Candidatus Polarisedimenticolia bacterium]
MNPPLDWWRPMPAPLAGTGAHASQGRFAFAAVLAFTFVLLVAPQTFLPSLQPVRLGLLTAAMAIAGLLADRFVRGLPLLAMTRETWISLGLLGWALLTVPFSYWPGGSLEFLADTYLKTLVIFWLLPNVVATPERLRGVAWALTLMAAPLAAFGINEYRAGRFVEASGPVRRILSYVAPLTQNPNDLALTLNLVLPLSLALLLESRRPAPRLLLAGCVALSVMTVIVTFSRAGFVTLAVTLGLYLARQLGRPGRGWAAALLAVLILCAPFLPAGYVERLGTITDVHEDPTGSAQERWGDMTAALRTILRSPVVGAGIGMNILALNEVRGPLWKKVHNVYLEHAADLGLPGLALFLWLFGSCLRAAAGVRRGTAPPGWSRPAHPGSLFFLAEGIEISLLGFAVAGLFHPVAYSFYFYYIAGLALAARAA